MPTNNNRKVSILLPAKNCGARLADAVASVLRQTFLNLELVIVDDHTTDGSIRDIRLNDKRLKVIANEGEGLVDALNTAAKHATGDYFARMDGDDICFRTRIEKQVEYLGANEHIGIVATLVEIFSDSCVMEGYRIYEKWVNSLVDPAGIEREIFIESPLPHPSVMFRRDAFEKLGGYRDMGWAEDFDMWLRAYEAGVGMGKVDEVLLKWRDDENRTSKTDPRYSKDSFMRARAHFLARTVLKNRNAIIWGAGNTGKLLCRYLDTNCKSVVGFIDINPRKIGESKAGRPVYGPGHAAKALDEIIIVSVAARGARSEIREHLNGSGKKEGKDYVCVV
ncbi:hypothetical protein MNBD_NITROSPINAE02-321 [hydrothermal vent metagenome]|uniref:Glycosyltransferase 2-like domain-containing protein n=1 Tax=hydrothermal vent metagenome TaxID=652676 RepID=A0A3B1BWP0_9ZZZZ